MLLSCLFIQLAHSNPLQVVSLAGKITLGSKGALYGYCGGYSYAAASRVNCGNANTDENSCAYTLGCCWDPLPPGQNGPNCYDSTKVALGYGTPGSDPGTTLQPNVWNTGNYQWIATSPVAALAAGAMPNSNQIIYLERILDGAIGTTHTYALDLGWLYFRPLHVTTDIFCSGGTFFSDGRLLAVGGYTGIQDLEGVRVLANDGDWKQDTNVAKLQLPRWCI
jgi:hypothetical protein